jgi:hypothetical protein
MDRQTDGQTKSGTEKQSNRGTDRRIEKQTKRKVADNLILLYAVTRDFVLFQSPLKGRPM